MLTCQQLTEVVTDYLEGRLPLGKWLGFQLHVGMCRHCRAYLKQMRATVRLTGKLPPDPIPPEVQRALLRRFQDWKR